MVVGVVINISPIVGPDLLKINVLMVMQGLSHCGVQV